MKKVIRKILWKIRQSKRAWEEPVPDIYKKIVLSRNEKAQIKKLWGRDRNMYRFYRTIKALGFFDARFCSNQYYIQKIFPVINPYHEFLGIQDKNFFDLYYADEELSFPEVLVKNIKGILFDKDMHVINEKQAVEKMMSVSEFVIKPSTESNSGSNVRKISNPDAEAVENLLKEYMQNFIVQKIIEQHPLLAELNETSVNSFRITTLFLNGKISVCSSHLKIGKKGADVDNFAKGSFLVGVDEHGNLGDTGYDINLNEMKISKELKLPFYQNVKDMAIAKHIKYFPNIGIIGWDLLVDVNGKSICIEINFFVPSSYEPQICNRRPFFGERTEEVVDYVKKHKIENLRVVI